MMNDYDKIIRENFDLSDPRTRKYLVSLDEAGRDQVLDTLSEALYDSIVAKVDEIDFGTIPLSRGDITKVENFDKTEQCLTIMRKLVLEYKQNPSLIDIITTTIQNIKDMKSTFIKGYALDVEFPMLIYNLMVLSTVRSTSMMIATCVQYISDPSTKTLKQALDIVSYKNTQDDVMFKQLSSFNSLCKDGSMMKMLTNSIKNNGKLRESADEYDVMSTPYDNDPEGTMPIEPTNEDPDSTVDPSSYDKDTDPFGCDTEVQPNPIPAPQPPAPVPQEVPSQEPVQGEDMPETIPNGEEEPEEPAGSIFVPQDEPQTDDLPVTEPDDTPEPIPAQVPVTPNQPSDEAPDINPDPTTDPNLDNGEQPIAEEDPENEDIPTEDDSDMPVEEGKLEPVLKAAGDFAKNHGIAGKVVIGALTLGTIIGGAQLLRFVVLKVLIPALRDLVYTVYNTSFKISDYWKIQADLLEANADELENTAADPDDKQRQKTIAKQRKWAERFRKWSNLANLDKKATATKVEKDKQEDEKNKKKIDTNDNGEDVLF